jgi:hypothetical protein
MPRSVLAHLQRQLQSLHDVDIGLDVDAYAIDATVHAQMPGAVQGLVEQLFVRDDGEQVELALYVARPVLQKLRSRGPNSTRTLLDAHSLEPYCIALEGVSHFIYVAWRAQVGRPVTALELELQAEVDKFICCWLMILQRRAHPTLTVAALRQQLFAQCVLRDEVPADEHDRYTTAHWAARRFCSQLVAQHGERPAVHTLVAAARAYFRRGLPDKLALAA